MGPANSIHQSCKVRSDVSVEGGMVFTRVGVIVFAAVRSIAAGKIIRALGVNEVDLVKVRVWDVRLEIVSGTKRKYTPGFETRAGRSATLTRTIGNSARIDKTP